MSEQPAGGADQHPALTNPVSKPTAPSPEFNQPGQPAAGKRLPDNRGHSPALDAREQQQQTEPQERLVRVGEADFTEKAVKDALAFRAEQEVRKQSLPQSPDKYEIKLPAGFKAPEGVRFEFDMNDPGLAQFRQLAHARGMDQQTFSDALGVYAANKISENQKLHTARAAELTKLGSAANARIDAIDTWLKSRVGDKGNLLVAQMKNYPVAAIVETFEGLMQQFSGQGGADFSQSGRQQQERQPAVPAYDGSNFNQVRAAQVALHNTRPQTPARVR